MADHHETKRVIFPNPSEAILTIEREAFSQYTTGFLNLWWEKTAIKLRTFNPLCQAVTTTGS
jgi:hypothetical protein